MRAAARRRPFVAVNCAALPESLIESELFGYEDGPSPARAARAARAAAAGAWGRAVPGRDRRHAAGLQSRLLRVLQEREVSPLGGRGRCRWISRCCAPRIARCARGRDAPVRPDLYFRIAEYTVTLGRCASGRTCASCCARSGTRRARRRRCRPWSSGRWPATPGRAIPAAGLGAAHVARAGRPVGRGGLVDVAGGDPARGVDAARHAPRQPRASPPSLQALADAAIRERWPRMAAMSAVRRVCWACTAARCTGAWRRWKRPGRTAVNCPDQARWRSGAGDQRISRASSAPGSGARMKASPTRKASTLCWRIS